MILFLSKKLYYELAFFTAIGIVHDHYEKFGLTSVYICNLEFDELKEYKRTVWCTKSLPMLCFGKGSIVCSLILHYKRLFLRLKSVTIKSHDNNFNIVPRLKEYITENWILIVFLYIKGKPWWSAPILAHSNSSALEMVS